MTTLTQRPPDAIDHMGATGPTLFYFGARPIGLARLPMNTAFSVVYLGAGTDYVVKYHVSPGDPKKPNADGFVPPEYKVDGKRLLTAEEVEHFEGLVERMRE